MEVGTLTALADQSEEIRRHCAKLAASPYGLSLGGDVDTIWKHAQLTAGAIHQPEPAAGLYYLEGWADQPLSEEDQIKLSRVLGYTGEVCVNCGQRKLRRTGVGLFCDGCVTTSNMGHNA